MFQQCLRQNRRAALIGVHVALAIQDAYAIAAREKQGRDVTTAKTSATRNQNTTRHHHSFCEQTGLGRRPGAPARPSPNSGRNHAFRQSRLMKKMFPRAIHTWSGEGRTTGVMSRGREAGVVRAHPGLNDGQAVGA
jgi:DNA-binding protein H-NS